MKKFLTVLILGLVCVFCAAGLVACGVVEFKLNFVVDGEIYATVNTNGGETIKMPDNPTKEDDVFDGWFWDKDTWERPFTANSLLDAPLSSDMNVYAKWKSDNVPSVNALLLSANGFTMNGLKGKISVSNDTEVYSFINQIRVSEKATWVISRDIYGMQTIATKTIPLNVGDNTVYLLITSGDGESLSLYIMTVHRRTFYTVSFNTNGGSAVSSQQIEEDSLATEPITTREGYTLDGWTYDFEQPITNNTVITAKWKANNDTPYQVKYYLQNLGDDNYALDITENLTGTTDTQVSAVIKNIPHYDYVKTNSVISSKLNGDGSTVLKVYYNLEKFTVKITVNGNVSLNFTFDGTYKYGYQIPDIIATYNESPYYEWKGWYSDNKFMTYDNIIPSFTIDRNINYVADCSVIPELSNFNFTSTADTCTITGVKDKTVTEIVVPDYVTNISAGAFSGCSKLESITIPFIGGSKVATSASSSTLFGYIFGTPSYTGGTATKQQYAEGSRVTYYIPSLLKNVTVTGGMLLYGAFHNCASLKSITLPNDITSIGDHSLAYCSSLTDIIIPNNVTKIGDYAFDSCSNLTNITIPDNVTSIGEKAFVLCTSLTNITISNNVTNIGWRVFGSCSRLTSITFDGTKAQWQAINKGSEWKYNVPSGCVVHCIDEDIKITNA